MQYKVKACEPDDEGRLDGRAINKRVMASDGGSKQNTLYPIYGKSKVSK